jgi:hypothetical protein
MTICKVSKEKFEIVAKVGALVTFDATPRL